MYAKRDTHQNSIKMHLSFDKTISCMSCRKVYKWAVKIWYIGTHGSVSFKTFRNY